MKTFDSLKPLLKWSERLSKFLSDLLRLTIVNKISILDNVTHAISHSWGTNDVQGLTKGPLGVVRGGNSKAKVIVF